MGKKPPLLAALSTDPVDDEPDSALVGDDSGTMVAAATDPVSAVAAQLLETGLIMLFASHVLQDERPLPLVALLLRARGLRNYEETTAI